jgi:CTP synthase
VDSAELTDGNVADHLRDLQGVIVPGGFGFRGVDGKISCIRWVRENKVPYLGICYGMQIAVIEFARNVAGMPYAGSTEIDADCAQPVIDLLPEQKKIEGLGGNMRLGGFDVQLTPRSLISELNGGAERIRLRFRHRYEVDPQYIEPLTRHGLRFTGKPVSDHAGAGTASRRAPFFLATQAHPELTSRPLHPQPMFVGLVKAALTFHGVPQRETHREAQPQRNQTGPVGTTSAPA